MSEFFGRNGFLQDWMVLSFYENEMKKCHLHFMKVSNPFLLEYKL